MSVPGCPTPAVLRPRVPAGDARFLGKEFVKEKEKEKRREKE